MQWLDCCVITASLLKVCWVASLLLHSIPVMLAGEHQRPASTSGTLVRQPYCILVVACTLCTTEIILDTNDMGAHSMRASFRALAHAFLFTLC